MSTLARLILPALLAACVTEVSPNDDGDLDDGRGDTSENFGSKFVHGQLDLEQSTHMFTGNKDKPRFVGFWFIADEGDKLALSAFARNDLAAVAADPMVFVLDDKLRIIAKNDNADGSTRNARLEVTLPASGGRKYFVLVRDSRAGTPDFEAAVGNSVGVAVGIEWQVTPKQGVGCALTAPDQTDDSQSINWHLNSHGGAHCELSYFDPFIGDITTKVLFCNDSLFQDVTDIGTNRAEAKVTGVDGRIAHCTLDVEITR